MEIPAPRAKAAAISPRPSARKTRLPRPAMATIHRGSRASAPSRAVGFTVPIFTFLSPGQNLEELDDPRSRACQTSQCNENRRRVQMFVEKPSEQYAPYNGAGNNKTQTRVERNLRPDV